MGFPPQLLPAHEGVLIEGSPVHLQVPEAAAGQRLDQFLATLPQLGSRAAAERLLRLGSVSVSGSVRPKSFRLEGGEELELLLPEPESKVLVHEHVPGVRVLLEDPDLLVVEKPAGVVVHPSAGHGSGTLVHALLTHVVGDREMPERPGIVHRLDRDTSGLLVIARSQEGRRALQRLLRMRKVTREYLALVVGRPHSRTGRIEAPLGRDRHNPLRVSLDTGTPRDAVTHFELVELLPRHALLRVSLETGRTHQIRVHLAAIGLPVAGDPTYGIPGELGLTRQFLHAARLCFPHPVTAETVDVSSPLPPELEAALAQARDG